MESLTIAPAAPRLRITFDKKPRPWDAAKAELKRLGFSHAGVEKTWEGPDTPETRAFLSGLGLAKAAPAKPAPAPVAEPEPERVPPVVADTALVSAQAATAVATLPPVESDRHTPLPKAKPKAKPTSNLSAAPQAPEGTASASVCSSELRRIVETAALVAPKRSVLPIIQHVVLEVCQRTLAARATDLENSIITSVSCESDGDFSIAVPAKVLLDTLKQFRYAPLTLYVAGNVLKIAHDTGTFSITGENAEDFPDFPETAKLPTVGHWPIDRLHFGLKKTVWACSTDELKPAMNGVCIETDSESTRFIATDAHRLAVQEYTDTTSTGGAHVLLLPQKFVHTFLKTSAKTDAEHVELCADNANVCIRFGNTLIAGRIIDARFPMWRGVMPESSTKRAIVNKSELVSVCGRLGIVANKTTHLGVFGFAGNVLTVTAEDLDYDNKASENVHCLYEGEDITIGFNLELTKTVWAQIATEDVIMEFDHPGRAAVVLPSQQEMDSDFRMLLMPVMLSTY